MTVGPSPLGIAQNALKGDRAMQAVSSRFDEIIHKLNHVADDIKIACAEASLDGDFAQVSKLSFASVKLQAFLKEITGPANSWSKELLQSGGHKNGAVAYDKSRIGKKIRTKLCVTIAGKQIQHKISADTFVATLENMGFERVANLGKMLSGIPLISKTQATGYQTQKKCGPWYVTTHASNKDMKILLDEIAAMLHIPIQVKIVEKLA
jgi:uncharacterized protein YoxC